MTTTGFHEGELAVQRRAGVEGEAARLEGMLDAPDLDGGIGRFLASRELAVLTARDAGGRLWISPLPGPPGFLDGHGRRLRVATAPGPGDPLAGLPPGQPVGLLVIDLAARRRVRVNGLLATAGPGQLEIDVEQAYGNCPKYIHPRPVDRSVLAGGDEAPARTGVLDDPATALIRRSDTFFLGSLHPDRGADASHRGGPAGFVRVEDGELWWPDLPGNNMFNSLGNLAVDDAVALLFLDVATGERVHVSGRAVIEWTAPDAPGDDGGTGRRVRVVPEVVVRR